MQEKIKNASKPVRIALFSAVSFVVLCCLCFILIAIASPTAKDKANSAEPEQNSDISTQTIQVSSTTDVTLTPSIEPSSTQPVEPSVTPQPTSTPEPLAFLRSQVVDVLGESNRDIPRISDFSWDPNRLEINVTFAAQDNLAESWIKSGIQRDIVSVLRTIYQSGTPLTYKSIVIAVTFPLVDVYGNSQEENVVIATYSKVSLDKVNWDNFLPSNVYIIANQDSLYLHPVMMP